jgi:hypothetical protein
MSLEKMGAQLYRDGLAESLKDIHKDGKGKEEAQQFLASAKTTKLYQEAEGIHRDIDKEHQNVDEDASTGIKTEEQPNEVPSKVIPEATSASIVVAEQEDVSREREQQEQHMLAELHELVLTNPSFHLGLSYRNGSSPRTEGKPFFSSRRAGTRTYYFDHDTGNFGEQDNALPGLGPHDPNLFQDYGIQKPKIFQPEVFVSVTNKTISGGCSKEDFVRCSALLLLPLPPQPNEFINDLRGDFIPFGGGLVFLNTEKALGAIRNAELKRALATDIKSPETQSLIWKFLASAFEKYLPEYWEYAVDEWKKGPGNKEKKIENFFENSN